MKTIFLIYLAFGGLLNPTDPGAEPEKTTKTVKEQKLALSADVTALLQYPKLKINPLDPLEARVFFTLENGQTIKVLRIDTNNGELHAALLKQLNNKEVKRALSATDTLYRINVKFE